MACSKACFCGLLRLKFGSVMKVIMSTEFKLFSSNSGSSSSSEIMLWYIGAFSKDSGVPRSLSILCFFNERAVKVLVANIWSNSRIFLNPCSNSSLNVSWPLAGRKWPSSRRAAEFYSKQNYLNGIQIIKIRHLHRTFKWKFGFDRDGGAISLENIRTIVIREWG